MSGLVLLSNFIELVANAHVFKKTGLLFMHAQIFTLAYCGRDDNADYQ